MGRRRLLTRACLCGLALLLLTAAGIAAWLQTWVPTGGKVWLERALESRFPIEVTIGRMRYAWWRGLELHDVAVDDRRTSEPWVRAASVQAAIRLLPLLHRTVVFHARTRLTSPCHTELSAEGVVELRSWRGSVRLRTDDIALDRLEPPLSRWRPSFLTGGQVRFDQQLTWSAADAPVLRGRITGTQLRWEREGLRITTDAAAEGTIGRSPGAAPVILPKRGGSTPSEVPEPRGFRPDLIIHLSHGQAQGVPELQDATDVSGTLRVTRHQLEIRQLRGRSLGAPWRLAGELLLGALPRVDVQLEADMDLSTLASRASALQRWQPQGAATLHAVCRGPLARWPELELMARIELTEASAFLPMLAQRLERVSGHIAYDHLPRRLTMEHMRGNIQRFPVTWQGWAITGPSSSMAVTIDTQADLELFHPLLPSDTIVTAAAGPVAVHLELTGRPAQPSWQGSATLTDARLRLRGFEPPIEGLSGLVRFNPQDITTPQLLVLINRQLLTVSGTVTALGAIPRLEAVIRTANGSLSLNAAAHPDRVQFERIELALGSSRLGGEGRISRLPNGDSSLEISGRLNPADLKRLPWLTLPWLERWRLEGDLRVQAQMMVPWGRWRELRARALLQGDTLSVSGVPLQNVQWDIAHEASQVVVRLPAARLASGQLTAELTVHPYERPPRFLFEGDAQLIDLGELAASLSAWKGRGIHGVASGHVRLTGDSSGASTWQGQGWVRAIGERLGNLPLLERLLSGLFGALADRLGLATLRTATITELSSQWQINQARIRSDDLRLNGWVGQDPILIYVRGSAGFDRTLDLVIEPELSEQLILQAPNTATPASAVLRTFGRLEQLRRLVGRHRVTGTIDKPHYKFEISLDQIFNQTIPSGLQHLFESLSGN